MDFITNLEEILKKSRTTNVFIFYFYNSNTTNVKTYSFKYFRQRINFLTQGEIFPLECIFFPL